MKMTVNNRFGILLAEKRIKERRPISLAEIAEATGISRKTLYAWENNKVNRFDVPVIDALCEYFGVQPGDLFHYVKPERGKSGKINLKIKSNVETGEVGIDAEYDTDLADVHSLVNQPRIALPDISSKETAKRLPKKKPASK